MIRTYHDPERRAEEAPRPHWTEALSAVGLVAFTALLLAALN